MFGIFVSECFSARSWCWGAPLLALKYLSIPITSCNERRTDCSANAKPPIRPQGFLLYAAWQPVGSQTPCSYDSDLMM